MFLGLCYPTLWAKALCCSHCQFTALVRTDIVTARSHERQYDLNNFDKTDREYSLDPTVGLIRFWRSKVKVTAGGEDIHVDAGALKFVFYSIAPFRISIQRHHAAPSFLS